jgi:LTXXQ motif family protein
VLLNIDPIVGIEVGKVAAMHSEGQQHALDELKAASSKAAGELQSSCPTEALHSRSDRLAAMNKRLDAMIKAVDAVRPSLQAFYASLSDEQKAQFNVIGHPQDQSARKRE